MDEEGANDQASAQALEVLQEELDFDDVVESMIFDSSSSDESIENERAPNKKRDFIAAYMQQIKYYFSGPYHNACDAYTASVWARRTPQCVL